MKLVSTIASLAVAALAVAGCGSATPNASTNGNQQNPSDNTSQASTNSPTNNSDQNSNQATTPPPPASTYTMAQVAQHSSGQSCWTAVNGSVYDVTTWINQHPGGPDKILGLCGTDGSAAFNGQHGGQPRPEQELATFKIGTLAR